MLISAAWAYRCDRKFPANTSYLRRHYLIFYAAFLLSLIMFLTFINQLYVNIRIAQQNSMIDSNDTDEFGQFDPSSPEKY